MTAVIGALGWVGCAMCLTGYYLVSSRRIMGDSLRYHALNMGGASLLAMACVTTGAWPSFFSNFIFIIIGTYVVLTTKRAYMAARLKAVTANRRAQREAVLATLSEQLSQAAIPMPLQRSTDDSAEAVERAWRTASTDLVGTRPVVR